jgi:hypothetical protein
MRKILFFLFIGLIIISCGKKEVKQVSEESKLAQETFVLIEKIRDAFVKNDMITLQSNSTEEGYKEITSNQKVFDSVELTFTPRWVDLEDDRINLNISWKSTWITSGRRTEDRGMAVFVIEGRPLKVSKILRANPFNNPEQ